MIKTIIVDDEALARERLRMLLSGEKDFEIVAECRNGREALKSIDEYKPSLVFLDVQMPGLDGFGVIQNLKVKLIPHIVFVTAYDKYAVKAFEVNAVDYLLKPFDKDRFHQTIERVRAGINKNPDDDIKETLNNILGSLKNNINFDAKKSLGRIAVKDSGKIIFVDVSEIDLIEAAGNYIRLYAGSDKYLLRDTMNSIEEKLDGRKFIRIHRSYIINIGSIKQMEPWFRGEYIVHLKNGKKINSSRTYKNALTDLTKSM